MTVLRRLIVLAALLLAAVAVPGCGSGPGPVPGVAGGFGEAFTRAVRVAGRPTGVCTLGLAQEFLPHGARDVLLAGQRLGAAGIAAQIRDALAVDLLRS